MRGPPRHRLDASHELAAHTLTYTLRAPSEALIESELQAFRARWRVRVRVEPCAAH